MGRYRPLIEGLSGLREGRDFDVVFSPERVLTGRVFADLSRYPKLVGGLSEAGEERGVRFYEEVLSFDERGDLPRPNGVWPMGGAEAAEMAKLAETTYRDVNIGLANQFARYADRVGIDIARVIDACNSLPSAVMRRWLPSAGRPTTWVRTWTWRSSRPITRPTRPFAPPTCPACASSSMVVL